MQIKPQTMSIFGMLRLILQSQLRQEAYQRQFLWIAAGEKELLDKDIVERYSKTETPSV